MTRRVIVTGTREELSAEDRAIATDLILRAAAWADEVGVGDCFRTHPDGTPVVNVDRLVTMLVPGAVIFEADWQAFGPSAGPKRNGNMVGWCAAADERRALGLPGPKSRGTWDCIRKAKAADVAVLIKRMGGPWQQPDMPSHGGGR